MKNFCTKFHFSFTVLLIIFLSFLSGLFRDTIILFSIIIIHEFGHVVSSLVFKWKIKRVDILVCGGFITYEDEINKPFYQEIIIAISGFVIQTIYFLIFFWLFKFNIIDERLFLMVQKYHYSILIFNLLPIYPLDGSKILLSLASLVFSYKFSLKLVSFISFINLVLVVILFLFLNIKFEISYLMIFIFILKKAFTFFKEIPYLFNKFLFERYNYPLKNTKYICILNGDLSKMKKGKSHYFLIDGKYKSERYMLSKRFDY